MTYAPYSTSMVVMRGEYAFFVVEFAFQDAQAGIGQWPASRHRTSSSRWASIRPCEHPGRPIFRGVARVASSPPHPVKQLTLTSGPVIKAGSQ